jgi:hypothetical protein
MRRRFPHPEQTSNGVSDKSLAKELDREEHADGVALDVLNIDRMKQSDAYVSMTMRHIHRQDQPKRKRLRTHETCSTAMRIDQFNAVRHAKRAANLNPIPSRKIQRQGARMATGKHGFNI